MFFCDKPPYGILAHKCPHIVVASFFCVTNLHIAFLPPNAHIVTKRKTRYVCVSCACLLTTATFDERLTPKRLGLLAESRAQSVTDVMSHAQPFHSFFV